MAVKILWIGMITSVKAFFHHIKLNVHSKKPKGLDSNSLNNFLLQNTIW